MDAAQVVRESDNISQRGATATAVLIAATFFVAIAPTLTWLEFSSTMENLVVATALEIRRGGSWMIPPLEGEPRVAKPPLAAWIAAGTIRVSTLAGLDDADPARRAAAYRRLAWDVRWPALLCSCLMLLAIFDLGRTVADARVGLLAMGVAATTLYFLRFGRQATTDVQLALWVSIADAAIARLVLRNVTVGASLVAGVALGLAFMSKGPVALLQTIVPLAALLIWYRPRWSEIRWTPIAVGAVLMLVVGGAWYAYVAMRVDVGSRWMIEVTRTGSQERSDHPLSYLNILLYMLPWTPMFVFGSIWTVVETRRQRELRWMLVLSLLIVPIAVMTCFPDRKERYLLPLLGPAALLAARGLHALLTEPSPNGIAAFVQWLTVIVLAFGLPIGFLIRGEGLPWFAWQTAVPFMALLALLIGTSWLQSRRRDRRFALVRATMVVMVLLQYLFFLGYRNTREGRSELRPLAEIVRRTYPDAQTHYWRPEGPKRGPVDFSIYFNRSTPWTGDPTALPRSRRPQVVITLQQRSEADPVLPPPWRVLDKVHRGPDWFVAFVREGQ